MFPNVAAARCNIACTGRLIALHSSCSQHRRLSPSRCFRLVEAPPNGAETGAGGK